MTVLDPKQTLFDRTIALMANGQMDHVAPAFRNLRRISLCVCAVAVATFAGIWTVWVPGMAQWNPGSCGVLIFVLLMAAVVRSAIVKSSFGWTAWAWMLVIATPFICVGGFYANLLWSFFP